jgi:hypothetical protein
MRVGADGESSVDRDNLQRQLDAMPVSDLTADEAAGLTKMREEELLAHDAYTALGAVWDVRAFDNIATSEQTHTEAVLALLDRHALPDPAADHIAGEFSDPTLQALYTDLVARGAASVVDALTVGATIEDLDIADLQSLATETADVALVYENLERGSRNHMRAFTRQLTQRDATYSPAYISPAEYDAIVSSGTERGSAG